MDNDRLIKSVQTTFKLSGLSISRKCAIHLARQLRSIDEDERQDWVSKIAEHVLAQDLTEPNVSLDHLKVAITDCFRPSSNFQETETVFNVIDGFRVPKIRYDEVKKNFVVEQREPDLFSEPINKSLVFKERLELLWHRTLRHETFAPLKFGEVGPVRQHLRQVEYLLSQSCCYNVNVMGVIAQLTEGQFYLEDASGVVKIDLSRAVYKSGLITEGCVVLVTGDYDDRILVIKTIGFPPFEPSTESRAHFSTANTFGGRHPVSLKSSERLKTYESNHSDDTIVFISELWLDNQIVLEKFRLMLDEFSSYSPPVAFVISGNFLSFPPNVTSAQKLKEGFKRLSDLVNAFPTVANNSKFVLIPGPYDPGAPRILPRAPLPGFVVEDFVKTVPGTILATNPCRIQYCTKEIVVIREDILNKLCRNTLRYPKDESIAEEYAKSIISQSHLAPMSLPMVPVYWKHDQALQLYPTPDLIVVADTYETYSTEFNECQVINPGVFSKNDFPFKVYVPYSDKIEDSAMERNEQN